MLFFLYNLARYHEFSVQLSHPLDLKLSAFLQSPASAQCLARGGGLDQHTNSYPDGSNAAGQQQLARVWTWADMSGTPRNADSREKEKERDDKEKGVAVSGGGLRTQSFPSPNQSAPVSPTNESAPASPPRVGREKDKEGEEEEDQKGKKDSGTTRERELSPVKEEKSGRGNEAAEEEKAAKKEGAAAEQASEGKGAADSVSLFLKSVVKRRGKGEEEKGEAVPEEKAASREEKKEEGKIPTEGKLTADPSTSLVESSDANSMCLFCSCSCSYSCSCSCSCLGFHYCSIRLFSNLLLCIRVSSFPFFAVSYIHSLCVSPRPYPPSLFARIMMCLCLQPALLTSQ